MGKCLITRLQGVVNDDSLEKLGVFRFTKRKLADDVYSGLSDTEKRQSRILYVNCSSPVDIEIVAGDSYFTDNTDTQNYGKKLTGHTTGVLFVSNVDDAVIEVSNKYAITSVFSASDGGTTQFTGSGIEADLSFLKYCNVDRAAYIPSWTQTPNPAYKKGKIDIDLDSYAGKNVPRFMSDGNLNDGIIKGNIASIQNPDLTHVYLRNFRSSEIEGNIEGFSSCSNLLMVQLYYASKIYGNINTAFGTNPNLTHVVLTALNNEGNNVSGDLNALLDTWFAAGKRGTVAIGMNNTKVTYNGELFTGIAKTFLFDENGWNEQTT